MAHVHGRPDNNQEHLDDILGRGPGDPDVYGYPGQDENGTSPKAPSQNKNRKQRPTSIFKNVKGA